jgi:hypothetical protein
MPFLYNAITYAQRVTAAGFAPANKSSYVCATALEGGEVLLWTLDPYVSNKMVQSKVVMGACCMCVCVWVCVYMGGCGWVYMGVCVCLCVCVYVWL